MARTSFILRAATTGSYLRDTALVPSALRADGVQVVPASSTAITGNSFSAVPVTYGSVELSWSAPLTSTLTVSPVPTDAIVVYSAAGIPQTIRSGIVMYEGSGLSTLTQTGLPQGQWAYYSLFLHFQSSGGDNYYEKVAELEVIVPTDYGSVLHLWNGIPELYRRLDTEQGTYAEDDVLGISALSYFGYVVVDGAITVTGDKIGPLFMFLSIIGFDMDYMRTLIDYVMVSKDPEVANSETLDALSGMLGVPLTTDDLGGARLRGILDCIGLLRRSKGTPSSIGIFASALAGGTVMLNANTHDFSVNSQRVNYIMHPKTGGSSVEWRPAHSSEVLTPQRYTYSGYSAYTHDISYVGTTWSLVPNAHGIVGALINIRDLVPVLSKDFVSLSIQKESYCGCIKWARLTDPYGNLVGISYDVKIVNGFPFVEIPVTDYADGSVFTNCTVDFMVDLSTSSFVGENFLLEANYVGEYFDGDTIRGGWLTSSLSASDYRWVGTPNASWSVYAEDYSRTVGIVKSLLPTSLPITEELKYSIIEYNGVRGFPLHRIPIAVELEDGSGTILTEDGYDLSLYDSIGL